MENYEGMTRVMDNGKEATIIKFRDFYDIDVMLCTGEISEHQQYMDFQSCDSAALGFKKKRYDDMVETNSNNNIAVEIYPAIRYNYIES